jgi:hypothetical protein
MHQMKTGSSSQERVNITPRGKVTLCLSDELSVGMVFREAILAGYLVTIESEF